MLYILTGDSGEGKSRWLYDFNKFLLSKNINTAGVLAPGIWTSKKDYTGKKTNVKIGINNILLPNNNSVIIAFRKDCLNFCSKSSSSYSSFISNSENYPAKKWIFSSEAIDIVNNHFKDLLHNDNRDNKSIVLVDEIGPKELMFNEGLTSAVEFIEQITNNFSRNAFVVVRPSLVSVAKKKFSMWKNIKVIKPSSKFSTVYDTMLNNDQLS